MSRKTILSAVTFALALSAMGLFLCAPARYAESVRSGISLWAVSVLPATFPFLFLTAVLTRNELFDRVTRKFTFLSRLFRISGAGGCAVLLSAVSGYPVGARTVAELVKSGRVKEEAFRLACLATTSGPMFLVGVVGTMLQGGAGWLLLLAHFFGVWSVCFFMRFSVKKAPVSPPLRTNAGSDALLGSVLSVLCVGGSIALFSAFGQMIVDLLPAGTPRLPVVLLRGLIEMTTGCAMATSLSLSLPLTMAFCAFFVTFGGACVLFQQLVFLSSAKINPIKLILVKALQGLVAAGAAYVLALLVY